MKNLLLELEKISGKLAEAHGEWTERCRYLHRNPSSQSRIDDEHAAHAKFLAAQKAYSEFLEKIKKIVKEMLKERANAEQE